MVKRYKYKGRETQYNQEYYQENKENLCARRREAYKQDGGKRRDYARLYARQHPEYRERKIVCGRKWRHDLKVDILTHYGGGKCACVKCGSDTLASLSIGDVDKASKAARLKLGLGGHSFYGWLKKNNYPPGYQTLCMNCQFVKRVEWGELPRGGSKPK